jgi:ABC-type branched-subunit amino acid transport system ATPase component/branched-subunit amino acid ABC-type transport system permease component
VTILQFALLGLGTGAVYALLSIGIVLVYRASGVLNFAGGAMGSVGAFVFYDLRDQHGWNTVAALVIGLVVGGALGAGTQVLVMGRLRQASVLTKVIATLSLLTVIQGFALIVWGPDTTIVDSILPSRNIHIARGLTVTEDRLILLVIGIVLSGGLKCVYSYTKFGLATSAVAESRRTAATAGLSAARVEVVNWTIGGALSALALILVAPIVGLAASGLALLIIPAIAAALIGGFRSFLLSLVGALLLGVVQSEVGYYIHVGGLGDAVPFVVIIGIVVAGGRAHPSRGDLPTRLPAPGDGKVNVPGLVALTVVALTLTWTLSAIWASALLTTFIFALLIMSVVVLTGYAGQLSLAQWAIAGVAALLASQLVATAHLPFWLAAVLGVMATVAVGMLAALPALRTRGVNLAIVTLAMAQVVVSVIFSNVNLTGGITGLNVGNPSLFSIDLNPGQYPARYATFALVLLLLFGLVCSNVRRGATGRRLLAIRSDERAAAAVGIGVYGAKVYAFGLAAAIAGVAGVLIAFESPIVAFSQFDVFSNISVVMFAVVGGIGWVSGTPLGATLASGSVVALIINKLIGPSWNQYLIPVAGLFVIGNLILAPEGLAEVNKRMLGDRLAGLRKRMPRSGEQLSKGDSQRESRRPDAPQRSATRIPGVTLEVRHVSLHYGGLKALNDVSFTVQPGEVVGILGPNGAGKTSLLDLISGFVRASSGDVLVDGRSITGRSPVQISRAGISRSFQAVQLFDAMTVRENLSVAVDAGSVAPYFWDLVHPKRKATDDALDEIVELFHLREVLESRPSELSHATARLVGVARALLSQPSILLLDEPAAGLDTTETAALGPMIRGLARERGISVVLVEHDVPLVLETCDRVVVLDFGNKIASGTPSEVRGNPAVIAAYLGDEASVDDEVAEVGSNRDGQQILRARD